MSDIAPHVARRVRDTTMVRKTHVSGEPHFDADLAKELLGDLETPLYFLDFESVQFAIPRWVGTRPFQQIPVQYSLHVLGEGSKLSHIEFLLANGEYPMEALANRLVEDCGDEGSIVVYNASFEKGRIKDLAKAVPEKATQLRDLLPRIVDLHPVTKRCYYHPMQRGSWSIKSVLSAVAPDLSYQSLHGVKDGTGAIAAYIEVISVNTSAKRRGEITTDLLAYCRLDTLAMVRLWAFLLEQEAYDQVV